jgi:diketogulonate reductase-like aldo/keto reductase
VSEKALSKTLKAAGKKPGDTVVAIPGATKEIHIKENCGAMSFSLSDDDIVRLDNVSAICK